MQFWPDVTCVYVYLFFSARGIQISLLGMGETARECFFLHHEDALLPLAHTPTASAGRERERERERNEVLTRLMSDNNTRE